jgi:predicted transcriptional regulator
MSLERQHRRDIEKRRKSARITKSDLARAAQVDLRMLRRFTNRQSGASLAWLDRVYRGLEKLGA